MLSLMRHTTRRRSPFVAPVDARAFAKQRSVIASRLLHQDHADCAWSEFAELWLAGVSRETPLSEGAYAGAIVRFLGSRPDATGQLPLINDRMVLQ
jgi:hypothetical protein